jgi:hypothetical protein
MRKFRKQTECREKKCSEDWIGITSVFKEAKLKKGDRKAISEIGKSRG